MKTFGEHIEAAWASGAADSTPATDWLREFLPGWRQPLRFEQGSWWPETPHISLCVSSMNRVQHLTETLPENIKAAEADVDCDIHVLDYSSTDGTAEYLADIDNERVKCWRTIGDRYWDMCRPRNMICLTAETGYLVILDADFCVGPNYLPALRRVVESEVETIVCQKPWVGLMAMPTLLFRQLGGHDLDMSDSYGHQDCDLLKRVVFAGAEEVWLPHSQTIRHIPHPSARDDIFRPDGGVHHEKMADERLARGLYVRNKGTGWESDVPEPLIGVYA
jgi:hypothetical protein